MKAIQTITASSVILILLCFFSPSNACHFDSSLKKLHADSFSQRPFSGLQDVSMIEIDDEFENEMPDESLTVYTRYTDFHHNNLNYHIFFEKTVGTIKISFQGHSPRSPSLQ